MADLYNDYKVKNNSVELNFGAENLFVTIYEKDIVHVSQEEGICSAAIEKEYIPTILKPQVSAGSENVKLVIKAGNIVIDV